MADYAQPLESEIDQRIERFDSSWRSGNVPAIDDFLSDRPTCSLGTVQLRELATELVMIDLEYRWRRAERRHSARSEEAAQVGRCQPDFPSRPRLEDYSARHPEIGLPQQWSTELIASEYRVRHRWGDRPDHKEYFLRFPGRERAIGQALESVDARMPRNSRGANLRIRCPHCHDSIELGDHDPGEKIACPSCDQTFSLVDHGKRQIGPGDRVGAFELLERLGAGSFGAVWKARDTRLDRLVAIKLPHQGMVEASQREQFLREARTAAQLSHPTIVPVYEVGRDAERLFIVTELVQGETLADWLAAERPAPREAAEICVTVADALEHAHRHGIVHRDLKPSNIMMHADGKPRLMDFGLAKRALDEVTMTVEGKLLGTPAYMSPEQAGGSAHEVDCRSDIYTVGVILFEMLTGERPFGGSTSALLQRILADDPIGPRKLSNGVPRDLETICLKCLEKDRQRRYQTAAQLRDDLRRFLHGEPVLARPITAADRAWRWCKRKPAVAALGVTAASLLVFLAVAGPVVAYRETVAREEMRRQLYVADMSAALQAWEAADVGRVRELLRRHRPQGNQQDLRRFEWYYLWRCCQQSVNTPTLELELPAALVAFSNDGATLASAEGQVDDRYQVKLWNVASRTLLGSLQIDAGTIWAGAFSPDLQTIALGYSDGTVRLRNILGSESDTIIPGHNHQILSLAFSPRGDKLASLSRNAVMLWDLAEGQPTWILDKIGLPRDGPPAWFTPMAFSPNGDTLAWGPADGKIRLYDTATGAKEGPPLSLDRKIGQISAVAYSPTGRFLASAHMNSTAYLWDVSSHQLLHKLEDHESVVTSVSFSADGTILATGSIDNKVKLWNVRTGALLKTLQGHSGGGVSTVAFSPRDDTLASGSDDCSVKLWNVEIDTENDLLQGHTSNVWSLAFSPDGQTLASGSVDKTIRLWDVATGNPLQTFIGSPESIWSVAYSTDGQRLISGGGDRDTGKSKARVMLWDAKSGKVLRKSEFATDVIQSVAFSPDGSKLAVGAEDGKVMLLDAATLELLKTLGSHAGLVYSVAFSPSDGNLLASGGADNLVKLWDVRSSRHKHDLRGHGGLVLVVAFSADGKMLASGSRDRTVRLWDVKQARELRALKGAAGWVMCTAIAPDFKTLVSGDARKTVRLWDPDTGRMRATLRVQMVMVHSATFSPDGHILAASGGKKIRLWRAATEQEVLAAGN